MHVPVNFLAENPAMAVPEPRMQLACTSYAFLLAKENLTHYEGELSMKNKKITVLTTAAALCISLGAYAGGTKKQSANWGSNSLSDESRGSDSPPMVKSKNAAIEGPMDTVDSTPGMLSGSNNDKWNEDRTVYRSGAPKRKGYGSDMNASGEDSSHRYNQFAYGDDLGALKGMQLSLALNQLHHMNQSQIGLAKMAESKAKSESVLNLAHQIRADYEKMEKKVEEIANARNIDLESFQLNTYEKVVRSRLNKLKAAEFETAFLRVIDRNHDMAMADLRLMRDGVTDTRVISLIDEATPIMSAHKESNVLKGRASMDEGDLGE